jgi:Fe-S-cluster containining protein
MSEGKSELVSDVLRRLYKKLDPIAEQRSKQLHTTCKTGCDSCCYLLATMTIAEGVLIAERLLSKPDWTAILPDLRKAAIEFDYPGLNKATYFSKAVPCVFLKNHQCSIYDVRPAACRYHYVASPPERCHWSHKDGRTAIIAMQPLEEEVWKLSHALAMQQPEVGGNIIAPIPLMVLFCLANMVEPKDPGHELLKKAIEGLPTPAEHLQKHMGTLMEGDGAIQQATPEELEELRKLKESR